MDESRWKRVEELFHEALAMEPSKRALFLEGECGGDKELLFNVCELIAADDKAPGFAEPPSPESFEQLLGRNDDVPRIGDRLGPYTLIDRLGVGGMAAVYLAKRDDDQFERRVAVKVVSPQALSEDGLRRFRRERQTIAKLEHPNIARLYDGGTSDRGIPYLVMEHVDGRPLLAHCDEDKLAIRSRLEVFAEVCHAVHFAHQNLIVHRDLKPDNILVTTEGVPKLLDFGIAKVIAGATGIEDPSMMGGETRLMTPAYASPEQLEGGFVGTHSDVYSLGVILYELLSGTNPSSHSPPTRSDSRPPTPSDFVRRPTTSARTLEVRQLCPKSVAREITADLDTIVMTAMHLDPSRRYASAEALSEDVTRYLKGFPILARGDDWKYRLSKFASRNRAAVSLALMLFVALIGGTVALWKSAQVAHHERKMALDAKGLADREAAEAKAQSERALRLNRVLEKMLLSADPQEGWGPGTTLKQLLDDAAETIAQDLEGDPVSESRLRVNIGRTYANLWDIEAAELHLSRGLALAREAFEPQSLRLADIIHDVASYLILQERPEEALSLVTEAQEILSQHPQERVSADTCRMNMGGVHQLRGEWLQAERCYRESLDFRLDHFGPDHLSVAKAAEFLAQVLSFQEGKHDEAKTYSDMAIRIAETLWSDGHPIKAIFLITRARLLNERGNMEEATRLTDRVCEYWETVPGHVPSKILAYGYRAKLHLDQRRPDLAEPIFVRMCEIHREHFGDSSPQLAPMLNNLAGVLMDLGRNEEAEGHFREALEIVDRHYEERHLDRATLLTPYGRCLILLDQADKGLEFLEEALEIRLEHLGESHRLTIDTYRQLGAAYEEVDMLEESSDVLRQALEVCHRSEDVDERTKHDTLFRLAMVMIRLDVDEALSLVEDYLKDVKEPGWKAMGESLKGECLVKLGRLDEAEPLLRTSDRVLRASNFAEISRRRIDELERALRRD